MIRLERVPVRDGGLQRLAGPLGRPDRGKAGRSDRSIGTATARARQNSEKQAELRNRRPIGPRASWAWPITTPRKRNASAQSEGQSDHTNTLL